MQGQRVQEYTVQTGPSGLPIARLGRVHNLITFIREGQEKLHYLDGEWYDDGKNPVDVETVPDELKQQAASIPFRPVTDYDASVFRNCEFCSWDGPDREYSVHLADCHIRSGARQRQLPDPVEELMEAVREMDGAPVPVPVRLKPDQLPPGNYELDDDGYVVMNQDGTARKRRGTAAIPTRAPNVLRTEE